MFWKSRPPPDRDWLESLQAATEPDGVRVLEHRFANSRTSLFLVSSTPPVAPSAIIRSVKGRLQHRIRGELPSAFQRNYSLISVGNRRSEIIERYVAGQLDEYPLVDPRLVARFRQYQISHPEVDLRQIRRSSYGEYCCNLHVVLEYEHDRHEFRHEILMRARDMLERSSQSKGWLLSRVGMVPNHLHLALGCGVGDVPAEVALSCVNNLTFVHGMVPVFKFGYYVGTFGPYDLGAIWNRQ